MPITNLRRSRSTSLLREDCSDNELIHLILEQEFSMARLGGGSRSSLTFEPSTSWSKDELMKQSCNSVLDQNRPLSKSLIPLSEAILECKFLRKFTTLIFDYYSRTNDPV